MRNILTGYENSYISRSLTKLDIFSKKSTTNKWKVRIINDIFC